MRNYFNPDMTGPESTTTAQLLPNDATTSEPEVSVDLTSELRWFFEGRPPEELVAWFTQGAATGLTEVRSDAYCLDGAVDRGVKLRFRSVLELKVRQESPEPFSIAPSLIGWLETWRRWSPADSRVELPEVTTWIDVDKTITKRRFISDGEEVPLSADNRAMTGDGCDVEIATISVEGRASWTFAFAAFGPLEHHRSLLETAWSALLDGCTVPPALRLDATNSFGYPAWMAKSCSGVIDRRGGV